MHSTPPTLVDCFARHGALTLFANSQGELVRYADIDARSRQAPFAETGRRLVFCLADNDLGGLSGYATLLAAGAVPLMLSAAIASDQLQQLVTAYRPAYLWLPEARSGEFAGAATLLQHAGYCLLAQSDPAVAVHGALALLLATSGSTGSPKFVRLSHDNLLSNAQSIARYLALDAGQVPITTLPPSYTYGLSILHSHMVAGATIAVTNKTLFDRAFWDFLRDVKATSLGGVPYHYDMLKKLRFTKMDLPSLTTLTQAGGHMKADMTREFALHCASRGMRFFTMYGQAEATARMAYLPHEKAASKAGSIGNAIPGGKFWLEGSAGEIIEGADTPGELVYQGPNVSMGYAEGCDDLALGDERQGVLRTGDVAQRDSDGDYYIVGRLKRFIKLFGHRVNLLDVEQFLLGHGHALACAGQDDRLELYLPAPQAVPAAHIKKLVVDYLRVAPAGVAVYGIDALPRSESGKIQYAQLTPHGASLLA